MADDKVIRRARNFANERRESFMNSRATDTFSSSYENTPQEVDFPIIALILALIIDVLDVLLGVTIVWSIFSFIIVLPIEMWYVNQREKKYKNVKIGGGFDFKEKGMRSFSKIQKLNSEAAELMQAGKTAEAAAKLGKAKRIFPPGLRWLTAIIDKIPIIGFIPGNTFLILFSYWDNVESVKAIQRGIKELASNAEFKITRVAGSNK